MQEYTGLTASKVYRNERRIRVGARHYMGVLSFPRNSAKVFKIRESEENHREKFSIAFPNILQKSRVFSTIIYTY